MSSSHCATPKASDKATPPTNEEIHLVEKMLFVIEKINAWRPLSMMAVADDDTKEKFHAWLTYGGGEKYKAKLSQFSETLTAWLGSLEVTLVSSGIVLYQRALSASKYNDEALELFFEKSPTMIDLFYAAFSDPKAIFEEANAAFKKHQELNRPDDTLLAEYKKHRPLDDKKSQQAKTAPQLAVVDIVSLNVNLQKWVAAQSKAQSAPAPAKKAEKISLMLPSSHLQFDTKKILKELGGEEYLAMMRDLRLKVAETAKTVNPIQRIEKLIQHVDKSLAIPEVTTTLPFVQDDELTNEDILTQLLGRINKHF